MTRIHPLLLVALLGLAACSSDPVKDAVVFNRDLPRPEPTFVHYAHDVHFAPAEARPSALELRALEKFLAEHEVSRRDEIALAASRSDRLSGKADARSQVLSGLLERRGMRVAVLSSAFDEMPQTAGLVRVTVHRALVTLPGCPDWSGPTSDDGTNQPYSNFGCADATNLGLMMARPSDLATGRATGAMDGEYGAAAIERYRQGKTKELDSGASNPSPVTVNMTQSSGSSGGAQ